MLEVVAEALVRVAALAGVGQVDAAAVHALIDVAGVVPELKGSIGEGSNHSNFSHQSSVKFLSKFRNCR